ncbi:MAG: hypothetical protein AUJ97_07240 [Bacteroidetes bacterium CG2_30_32_10]|nr:MAG: hypothetical protein AUJ97_07240 [Bacteroidetes bacterium CG2_30_32_10]
MKVSIAITDISILLPFADSVSDLWSHMQGNNTLDEKQQVYKINNFTPQKYLGKNGFKYYTQVTRYLISSILPLFERNEEFFDSEKFGIVAGTTHSAVEDWGVLAERVIEGGSEAISPMETFNFSMNIPASTASIRTGAKAFNITLSSGSGAGYDAIGFACDNILLNNAEKVLACGFEVVGDVVIKSLFDYFLQFNMPFGVPVGEGSAVLLLQSSEHLEQTPLGVITAYNTGFISKSTSNKDFIFSEMVQATLNDSSISSKDIDLIISGNVGKNNSESNTILQLSNNNIPISTFKEVLCESFSVSNIIHIVLACLALEGKYITSTLELFKKNNEQASNNSSIKNILITYEGDDGFIFSTIITK